MADNRAQQIDLLFGVKGGSKLGGESGKNIKSQIDGIVKQLNHSPYTISIKANETELIKIEQRLDNIRSKITSMPALDVGVAGGGENDLIKLYDKVVKRVESVATKNLKLPELNADLSETKTYLATVERLDKLSRSFMDSDGLVKDMGSLDASAIADMKEYMRVSELVNNQIRAADIATKALAKSTKQASTESMSAAKMLNKVYTSYNKFTNIKDYKKFNDEYQNLINELSGKTSLTGEEVKDVTRRINELENACFAAGVQADTLGEAIEHKISDRLKYLIGQFAIDFVVQGLRRIYDNVLQIDSAMTELKKVTDETGEAYDRFLTNAGKRAKELGASLVEVVNMTADYARLGYDVDEASNLADAAIIYRNVGDGLKNADEATDHLISTMEAFGIEASNSMRIVDAFNEVSNNFAVTSSDIGAGLQRSSAAMAAAGNSMEETIALFTAGNTIIRDADTMGTSLKTISMRLRSTKSDLEAMGEDTDGAAESVSSLRKELLALTGVDIQLDENTYKNTYEILQELSKVWDNLDDLTQANVLEKLFGKLRANSGAAILKNFNIAEEALETAMNSAGSAVAENEKYLESIRGHLDQLTASFQTLSTNVLDSELVKFGVDALRLIVDLLNEIFVLSHGLGDALKEISPLLGEIVNLIGTLTVMAGGASLIDGLFGFKHVKEILNGLKNLKAGISLVFGDGFGNIWENIKTLFPKLDKLSDYVIKVTTAFKSASLSAGGLEKILSSAGGGFLTIAAAVLVLFGQIHKEVRSAEHQMKKMKDSLEEYENASSALDEYNETLKSNEERLKELKKIPWADRTKEQQAEINKIEEENDLLQDQISYYKELKELTAEKTRDDILDSIDKTAGHRVVDYKGTFYTMQNDGVEYYSLEQAEYLQAQVEKYQALYHEALTAGVGTEEGQYATQEAWDNAVKIAKSRMETIESLWNDFKTNTQTTYKNLFEVIDITDDEAMDELRELANILKMLGLWTSEDISGSIEFLGISSIEGFEKIKQAIDDTDGLVSQANLKRTFGTDAIDALVIALEIAGISWQEFIDYCNEAESESPVVVEVSTEELDAAKESIKSLSSSCKTMSEAFKEQNENGSLSVDTILEIMEAGYGAALAVDAETGAVRINASEYRRLAQDKFDAAKKTWENILASHKAALAQYEEAKAAGTLAEVYGSLANAEIAAAAAKNGIIEAEAALASFASIDLSKVISGLYGVGNAASDAKSKLSNLQSGMENLLSQTISWLKQEYNDAQEAQENYYESQIDALEDAKDAAKDRWDAEKEAIEDAKNSYNDLIDAQIELLKRQKEADDYAKNRAEKEDAVADIENQLLAIENDDSIEAQKMRLELQEQLKEAKDELEELQSDREYELREQALQDEKDRYNDEIDAKLDAIEKQSEAEEKAYQDRIDRLQKYLDAVRDSEKTEAQWRAEAYDWIQNKEEALYQELIEWNRIYGVTTLPLSGNRH